MFEEFLNHISYWIPYTPYILFGLLLLAGVNIPISEDLILLTGGMIANRYLPEETLWLYGWIYLGCIVSAWEAYAIGRFFGPKLYEFKWSRHFVTPERVEKLSQLLHRYGIFVFLVGRFVPGGMRNALFMSSGLCKMPFHLFLIRDGIACLISTSLIFTLGFIFSENYESIISFFKSYNKIVIITITSLVLLYVAYIFFKKNNKDS